MKRRVIQRRVVVVLLLLLAGGAIVNVAVACAHAVHAQAIKPRSQLAKMANMSPRAPGRSITLELKLLENEFGMPMTSLRRNVMPGFAMNGCTSPGIHVVWPRWLLGSTGVYFPTCVAWPGFAINTIFYAAMLWVVFFAPGMVKRTLRRRRGLCPAFAYPVGTSPVCTECGNEIPFPLRGRAREGVGRTETSNAHDDAERSTHPLAPSLKGGGKDSA